MTAPGAVAGTACCVLAGITNSRVPARTAIIRIARPGTTDALVAPPPAERRLRRADRRLHARCVRVHVVPAALAAAVGGGAGRGRAAAAAAAVPRRSEEHTSELQSLMRISYAVFCLHKKNNLQKYTKIDR